MRSVVPGLLPVALPAKRLVPSVLLRLLGTAYCLGLVVIRLLPVATLWCATEAEGPAVWNTAFGAAVGVRTAIRYTVAAATRAAVLAVAIVSPTAASLAAAVALTATVAIMAAVAALTTAISVVAPVAAVAGSAAIVATVPAALTTAVALAAAVMAP